MKKKTCSLQTMRRLPYYLYHLRSSTEENCSAAMIAREFRLNEVQVRKDLAAVSSSGGSPRKGFRRIDLIKDLEEFLGYNNMNDAIIVGVGHLGKALINFKGFKDYGVNIVMGFDKAFKHEEQIGKTTVFPMVKMKNMVQRMKIKLGIITVNEQSAQFVCNQMIESGIKAIWNFSPYMLKVPEGVLVQNENMAMSLAVLSKHLTEETTEKKETVMEAE